MSTAQVNGEEDSPNVAKILDICNELQVGVQFESTDLKINKFKSGYVSEIYRVNLLKKDIGGLPSTIVIKFYNPSVSRDETGFQVVDSQLNSLMIGQVGLGPKVFLIRPDAIVIEYLAPNETLNGEHDLDATLREDVARKLARLNSLSVPIGRNTHLHWLRQIYEVWCSDQLIASLDTDPLRSALVEHNLAHLLSNSLRKETDFVYNAIRCFATDEEPVIVFSHTDFNHLNLLVVPKADNTGREVKFIDFDFSSYSFRGVDLGRYFVDVGQPEQFHGKQLVADEQMIQFLEWYRDENAQIYGAAYLDQPKNSIEALMKEAKLFALNAYMIDIIFCIFMAAEAVKENDTDKVIEFLLHADKRFSGYMNTKFRFLQDGSIP